MNWTAQVVHVAGKDLRQSWWQLLVYALVVALATLAGADLLGGEWMAGSMLFVCGAGLLVLAMLIHADPPARTGAVWALLPLEWSAVLAAKFVLVAVILIGLGVAGQAVVLAAYDVAAAEMLRMLGVSLLVYSGLLVFGGMLAILTRDVKSFLLLLLLVLVASQFVAYAFLSRVDDVDLAPAILIALGVVGVLVIIWQYRSFDRWKATAAVLLLLLMPAALPAVLPPRPPEVAAPATVPPDLQQPVRMSHGGGRSGAHGIVLSVAVDTAAAGHRYVLRDARAALHTSDGTRSRLETRGGGSLNTPSLVMDGEELVNPNEAGQSARSGGLSIELTRDQAAALEQGNASLEVTARVEVQESRVRGVTPLVAGTRYAARGLRLEILDVDHAERQITLTTSSIRPSDDERAGPAFLTGPHILALVNLTRSPAEEITLHSRSGGGNSLGSVIPGIPLRRWTGVYGSYPLGPSQPAADPDWMHDASLLVGEWVSLGSYPITVTVRPSVRRRPQ